jgi:hypothetical protein
LDHTEPPAVLHRTKPTRSRRRFTCCAKRLSWNCNQTIRTGGKLPRKPKLSISCRGPKHAGAAAVAHTPALVTPPPAAPAQQAVLLSTVTLGDIGFQSGLRFANLGDGRHLFVPVPKGDETASTGRAWDVGRQVCVHAHIRACSAGFAQ